MNDLFSLLEQITALPTPSGWEQNAVDFVATQFRSTDARIQTDPFGNIKAIFGSGDILLDAHIDKIGMIVTHIDSLGFLHAAAAGSVDERTLAAADVTVFGNEPLYGAVTSVPPHLAGGKTELARKTEDIAIDIGMNEEEAKQAVQPGDRVLYRGRAMRLFGDRICAPYLDNSAGVAVMMRTAQLLRDTGDLRDITLCFSAQEETGLRGASPAAFGEEYRKALVFDASFANAPGVRPEKCGRMGGGVMIGFSPVLNAGMSRTLRSIAEEADIPHSCEVMGRSTGTNSDILSKTGRGLPTALLSVPIRNMHTPAETVCLFDMEQAAALAAEWIRRER